MIKRDNNQRLDAFAAEAALLTELMLARTADEWEEFLQARRVPAGRARNGRFGRPATTDARIVAPP